MYCRNCGAEQESDNDKFCRSCGISLEVVTVAVANPVEIHPEEMPMPYAKKWNWGAFLWAHIWSLGNMGLWRGIFIFLCIISTGLLFVALFGVAASLITIPFDLIIGIIFGINGNRWAWKYGPQRDSIVDFERKQRVWMIVALVIFIINISTLPFSF